MKRLRDERVEDATRALGSALRVEEEKQAALAVSAAAKTRLEQAHTAVRKTETSGLEGGGLSAGDLAQAASWEAGARRRAKAAADAELAARKAAGEAAAAVVASRNDVGARRADADAVARLLLKAQAKELAKTDAQADESAEEAFAARARRGART